MCAGKPAPLIGLSISPNGAYVCGYWSSCFANDRAFVYKTATNERITLPLPAGTTASIAYDVNDSGLVCGMYGGSIGTFGFIYDVNTGLYIAQLPAAYPNGICEALAINSSGVVCGYRHVDSFEETAFIWSAETGFIDIGVLIPPGAYAVDINDDGNVVGHAGGLANPSQRGFIYQNGRTTVLPPIVGGVSSSVPSVNDHDVFLIAGAVQFQPNAIYQGHIDDHGLILPLVPLPGFVSGGGNAISNDGTVVGSSLEPGTGYRRVTVWRDGQPLDLLNMLRGGSVSSLQIAWAIGDGGRIVAVGEAAQASTMTFVFTPIPSIPGDTNCDRAVNVGDLLHVIGAWGPCQGCSADLDANATVNINDLLIVIIGWNS
jgi:uncharacterized membrane protein